MGGYHPALAAILIYASRTSLEELVIAPPGGLQKFLNALRENWSATDTTRMRMQNLRSLMLRISHPPNVITSVWPCLDDAQEILNLASTGNLAVLNVTFSLDMLHELPKNVDNPSLRLFEQSIARFAVGRTNVSFSAEHWRKNRDASWATSFFAKAFPGLYGQGKLKVASQ